MVAGLGIDTVEINRFVHWHHFDPIRLYKVFTKAEVAYCLENDQLSAQRFAVRFAAREAFFKALGHQADMNKVPFLMMCRAVKVERMSGRAPELVVDWQKISSCVPELPSLHVFLSLCHTQTMATAIVLLEQ